MSLTWEAWRKGQSKVGVSLSFGDRHHPFEGDLDADIALIDPMVGKTIEVSDIAGGSLSQYKGRRATIDGVLYRLGVPVAYRVKIEGGPTLTGSAKDFYMDRCLVEDAQPATPMSAALREGLSHWNEQRDYWHEDLSGLEAMSFAVASITAQAGIAVEGTTWMYTVPELMPSNIAQVRCSAFLHNSYWTVSTAVVPLRSKLPPVSTIPDHWNRTFLWTLQIAEQLLKQGWAWDFPIQQLKYRMKATKEVLRPMVSEAMSKCVAARKQIEGKVPEILPISAGFSQVRLKAGTIGLTEPPSDRRPYTVLSVAPSALKDKEYLKQVVLHECVHIVVASNGGPPHNELFMEIADMVGLAPQHRE